ncbi:MAG: stage V sporulation protein SpoVM [Ruminococcus sp.]|nr:stage V sporulation protein SpoVM [Ruminococcus sp.]MBQ1814914.1 stage V sporulation protein SpoVM [Ruminococcus sp.]MEE1172636.1 stage V sporulation protein SpoVM [Ruminococcus sp.]
MLQTKDKIGSLLWHWAADRDFASYKVGAGRGVARAGISQYFLHQEVAMKVVLIEKPRFISALLRKLYGIKKQPQL